MTAARLRPESPSDQGPHLPIPRDGAPLFPEVEAARASAINELIERWTDLDDSSSLD